MRGPPQRLDPALESEIRAFVAAQRAPGTRLKYEEYVRDFLKAAGIATVGDLLGVQSVQVIDYRNALQLRGLSNATVNGRLTAIRGFFGQLYAVKRIPGNPADTKLVKGLQVSDVSRTEGLTLDEVKAILDTCDGTRHQNRFRAPPCAAFPPSGPPWHGACSIGRHEGDGLARRACRGT